jgi:hypothetical protein
MMGGVGLWVEWVVQLITLSLRTELRLSWAVTIKSLCSIWNAADLIQVYTNCRVQNAWPHVTNLKTAKPRQLNENKTNLMRFWHVKIIMRVYKRNNKMSLWFVSDRGQEHQQDHASPHGHHVDLSGPGHVSYHCDHGKQVYKCYSWSFSVCKLLLIQLRNVIIWSVFIARLRVLNFGNNYR